MNAALLASTSAIIPMAKAFDGRKWMIGCAEDSASIDLFEINRFVGDAVIGEVFRQRDLRYIHFFRDLFIQPFRNIHAEKPTRYGGQKQ